MKQFIGFLGSRSEKYIQDLSEQLVYENVKKSAVDLEFKKTFRGKEYSKFVRIDFLGIAATTLFDAGEVFPSRNVFPC